MARGQVLGTWGQPATPTRPSTDLVPAQVQPWVWASSGPIFGPLGLSYPIYEVGQCRITALLRAFGALGASPAPSVVTCGLGVFVCWAFKAGG